MINHVLRQPCHTRVARGDDDNQTKQFDQQNKEKTTELTRSLGPCKSPNTAIGWAYFSSISRIMLSNSRFCSCAPCEKFNRKTSAPARKSFSIMSLEELAGPNVTTCFVDFLQRCATLGTAATVVEPLVPGVVVAVVEAVDDHTAAEDTVPPFTSPFTATARTVGEGVTYPLEANADVGAIHPKVTLHNKVVSTRKRDTIWVFELFFFFFSNRSLSSWLLMSTRGGQMRNFGTISKEDMSRG